MLVGVLGINHKLANVQLREVVAKVCQRRFGPDQSIHEAHTFILLLTCNRTEIYFHSDDLAATHTYILNILRYEIEDDFDQKLYSYFGYDCFLHLARVTAGLDSAIIAETEIQSQVKKAYEAAILVKLLPKELHFLFQKALTVGKKVRSTLLLQRGFPALEQVIFKTGQQQFQNISLASILFVGASEINCKVIDFFKSKNCKNISLCNRSEETAKTIAKKHQINYLCWNDFDNWLEFDWIILATKSPHYLIKKQSLPSSVSCKLIIDLSVPRNAEPSIGHETGITLTNIDDLLREINYSTEKLTHTLAQTEKIIAQDAKRHVISFKEKMLYSSRQLITA